MSPSEKSQKKAARQSRRDHGGKTGLVRAERAARCLHVLGHETRLLIIEALRDGEKTVTEIEEAVGGSQSNLSQHLRLMRDREILSARKEGARVYYSVSDPRVVKIIDAVKEVFCEP